MVIPKAIHDRLGLHAGDYLEVELKRNCVVLTPQTLVERRLAEALEDLAAGRVHGPFTSAKEMIEHLRAAAAERRSK